MNLTRQELCIIQQALDLRRITIINGNDLKDSRTVVLIRTTSDLRSKILREIGKKDRDIKLKIAIKEILDESRP